MVVLNIHPKTIRIFGAACGIFIAIGGIIAWIVLPYLIVKLIDLNVILYENSDQFERWQNLPQPLEFKVYIFNVTNSDDVARGSIPIVKEVGPYVYKQYRVKNVEKISKDKEEITYTGKQIYKFDSEMSHPFKETDEIVVLNVPMNAVLQVSEDILNSRLEIVHQNILRLFPNETSLFMKTTPRDYFFDGIRFCVKGDALIRLICKIIEGVVERRNIKAIKKLSDGSLSFAFFYFKNNTHDGHYKILSGTNDSAFASRIVTWEGKSQLSFWKNNPKSVSSCNLFRNSTDGLFFPPHLEPKNSLTVFSTDVCRSVQLFYKKTITYRNIVGYRFETSDTFLAKIGSKYSTGCFCTTTLRQIPKYDDGCLYEGVMDLSTCQGVPIILSMPHLLDVAPQYKTVKGLHPDAERGKTFVDVEPKTGYPLRGYKRAQFNMFVRKFDEVGATKNFKTFLLPLIWIEEGIELNDKMINLLNNKLFTPLLIANILIYTVIGSGTIIFFLCVFQLLKLYSKEKKVSEDKIIVIQPIHTATL